MFKVLVVDDDDSVNLFITRLLQKKFACTVTSARNGLEALSKIKTDPPEVIFLDVTMPVMNGIETLQALRADDEYKDLPVIMMTAVSERHVVGTVMQLGVLDYILKPLIYDVAYKRIKEIFDKVKEYLKNLEAQKELEEKAGDMARDRVLVIDTDKTFCETFKKTLEKSYEVFVSDTGADGLRMFMELSPKIVCLGTNLPLLNEKMLAQKIRKLCLQTNQEVTIFAITESGKISDSEKSIYDCVVNKNKTEEMFLKDE